MSLPIAELLDVTPGGLLLVGSDKKNFARVVFIRHGKWRALWCVIKYLWVNHEADRSKE